MTTDALRAARRLAALADERHPARRAQRLARITDELTRSTARAQARAASVPVITYPDLPVADRREDLLAALREHQVVVVAGETGSGKTTQLPKLLLELGRGVRGMIGHTQPRRIAARSVATRIAEELAVPLGEQVGYAVRFDDVSAPSTLVRLLTDGLLLAEVGRDRLLSRYDTIIVDEAHERSLTIDFLLGYLVQLLPQRPDLKVVITSATIDPQRFAEHFAQNGKRQVPVVEVSGRTFPVEVRYRPLDPHDDVDVDAPDDAEPRDLLTAVGDAVVELSHEPSGDVLVFLAGEREIRDTAEALTTRLPGTEILPLYGRLSAGEQQKVFSPSTGRRVVLATNVAETSLTVPGIRYVVDPGTARISRYSLRTKVQRLPVEPISQASATQRAGRCGRVADGVAIRLYSEADFQARPVFTEPEILRTNLASVLLTMATLDLGAVSDFPFLDPPDARQVRDAEQLLLELGAFTRSGGPTGDGGWRVTETGRRLAQLPVDPRIARMLIEADRHGVLPEVLVIASGLSVQDPRERPPDAQDAADAAHRGRADPRSDFLSWLRLWAWADTTSRSMSGSAFRRLCRREYLHHLRLREWQDLHGQLRGMCRRLGMEAPRLALPDVPPSDVVAGLDPEGPPLLAGPAAAVVHRAILAGLLSQLGLRLEPQKPPPGRAGREKPKRVSREYLGSRGTRFVLWPGSGLARTPPPAVMVAELVETSRLFARTVGPIEPEWAEQLAGDLVVRTWSQPRWSGRRGSVVADEKVTLYGVPLVPQRTTTYSSVDPEYCRELFLRHALVEGDWRSHHTFLARNRALLDEAEQLEHRSRRRDVVVDDDDLYAFYDARTPADVVSGRHFDRWWKTARRDQPTLLDFDPDMLVRETASGVSADDFPLEIDGLRVGYVFSPGDPADGVTVTVPLDRLATVDTARLQWQVPGLRHELVTELIRGLPKPVRRLLVPAPDTATALLDRVGPDDGPLRPVLSQAVRDHAGVVVAPSDWPLDRLDDHLRVRVAVVDAAGQVLGADRDPAALAQRLVPAARTVLAAAAPTVERTGLTGWPTGDLPQAVSTLSAGRTVTGYPALVDRSHHVDVVLLGAAAAQARTHARGVRRLVLLALASPRSTLGRLDQPTTLALARSPHGDTDALLADCAGAALDAVMARLAGPGPSAVWTGAGFATLLDAVRPEYPKALTQVVTVAATVLQRWSAVQARLDARGGLADLAAKADERRHVDRLVHTGFVTEVGAARLGHLPRYLDAVAVRLDRAGHDPARDTQRMTTAHSVEAEWQREVAGWRADPAASARLAQVRWQIEELRVGLFAPTIRTAHPVSEQRVLRALDDAVGR